ncbi:transposase [Virgibacillus sp. W0181]|uniref:transposase n=1 Tax=Virgibacillus sp. W0181 TaxID=3391581 RepID=UPI003F4601EB
MTNHIHLQIEVIDQPTGKIMKHVHFHYATYLNQKYHFIDHVFESRYAAELLTDVDYELEVNRYIHLNPIREVEPEKCYIIRLSSIPVLRS